MKFNIKPEYRPYLIGGAAALILYYILFRKKKLLPDAQAQQSAQEEAQAVQTNAPTYPNSQYSTYANQLESAMYDIGTDENTIIAVFKAIKNDADYLKLFNAFGKRTYTGGYFPGYFYGEYDLTQWIREELSESDIQSINNGLAQKGIKYRI